MGHFATWMGVVLLLNAGGALVIGAVFLPKILKSLHLQSRLASHLEVSPSKPQTSSPTAETRGATGTSPFGLLGSGAGLCLRQGHPISLRHQHRRPVQHRRIMTLPEAGQEFGCYGITERMCACVPLSRFGGVGEVCVPHLHKRQDVWVVGPPRRDGCGG